jgi:propionyl-CoA carboxylase alpha chain
LIAEGHPLSFTQDDLRIQGHSIEVRVYAEDPRNNFLPDIGRLETYIRPQGPGVRVDDGFEQGMFIPIYYDPMIAKLVTHDENREKSIERMLRAIEEYQITGIETTLAFCTFVLKHEKFKSGDFDTKFIEKYFTPEKLNPEFSEQELSLLAAFAVESFEKKKKSLKIVNSQNGDVQKSSNWKNRLI